LTIRINIIAERGEEEGRGKGRATRGENSPKFMSWLDRVFDII
jgi:hypothetical protein